MPPFGLRGTCINSIEEKIILNIIKSRIFIGGVITVIVMSFSSAAFGLPRDLNAFMRPSVVQFQLIDPAGNVTGYDPATGGILKNIPNTDYYWDAEPTGPIEPTKYQQFNRIGPITISDTTTVATGIYTVKVFGSVLPEAFDFALELFYHGYMGPQVIGEASGTVTPNTTLTYQVTVPAVPPPGGLMPMTLIASSTSVPAPLPQAPPASGGAGVQNPPIPPQNPGAPGNGGNQNKTNDELRASALIDHITANGQAGLIGGPEYVDELVKKVNEIEKEITESHERHENYS